MVPKWQRLEAQASTDLSISDHTSHSHYTRIQMQGLARCQETSVCTGTFRRRAEAIGSARSNPGNRPLLQQCGDLAAHVTAVPELRGAATVGALDTGFRRR